MSAGRHSFYPLPVRATREEIGGAARSLWFEVPAEFADRFAWRPGQHLTLRFVLGEDAEELRRSYTISSSPFSERNEPAAGSGLRITVKRVRDGRISNHINDHLRVGSVVEVMPPLGGFVLDPKANLRRTHYFIGAGSGITPLRSMIESVLLAEPHSFAHLLFGNRKRDSILLGAELDALAAAHPGRFSIAHVLSAPSAWSGSDHMWRKGKIDRDTLEQWFAERAPYAQDTQYYLCGPGSMNADIKAALQQLDVPAGRIHFESFGGAGSAGATDDSVRGQSAQATILLDGERHQVPIQAGQTLLQAAFEAGLEPPFSCQAGVCAACHAKLVEGRVHMRSRPALADADVEAGSVLTCQAVATCTELTVDFDAE